MNARAEATRAALVTAAIEVLGESGARGASARTIAGRAGVNQALVFYHFGSVDGLLLAALDAVADRRWARLGPALAAAATPADLVDLMHTVVTGDVEHGTHDLAVLTALLEAGRANPDLAAAVGNRLRPWEAAVAAAIERATPPLLAPALPPATMLARLAMATVLGQELLAPTGTPSGWDPAADTARFAETLRDLLED